MADLWQIGIDVLPDYRRKGLAAYLVKTLASEIERRGKLAYYTTWSANIASTITALNAGFVPARVGYHSETV